MLRPLVFDTIQSGYYNISDEFTASVCKVYLNIVSY